MNDSLWEGVYYIRWTWRVVIVHPDPSIHGYKGHMIVKTQNVGDDTITVTSPSKGHYDTRLKSTV